MKKSYSKWAEKEARSQLRLVALKEVVRQELREFVVSAGMVALSELLEEERTEACGPRYRHQPGRKARRAGHVPGELVMGGRRVGVKRPRARSVDGCEVELPSWRQFSVEDPLHERALTQMLIGVSTRKYERSLEPVAEPVKTRGTSKSAVSRRFVAITKAQMDEWFARDLSGIDAVVVMLDGVYIADHVILVAVGIDSDDKKHVLGIREGATENATARRELLVELRRRGLSTEKTTLFVLDGAKALRKGVVDVWGERAKIQRCQAHKVRNVMDQLPEYMRSTVKATMRAGVLVQRCRAGAKATAQLGAHAARRTSECWGVARRRAGGDADGDGDEAAAQPRTCPVDDERHREPDRLDARSERARQAVARRRDDRALDGDGGA